MTTQCQTITHLAPQGSCILHAVTAQVARTPDATALTSGAKLLTYRELDSRSNGVAHRLRALGVSPDQLIGVCLPRSFDLVIAALGIWKAGAAYIPIDPSYPPERLSFILNDAQVPLLVATGSLAQRIPHLTAHVVDITDPDVTNTSEEPLDDLPSSDLAYVIYTSGSTGTPKGVEITHAGLANLVAWHCEAFSVTPADRASHVAGLGFDASVWELWPYLASGASVHLADDITRTSPELLRDWIISNHISISFVPTPVAERMLFLNWKPETALRLLLTGGDTLHHSPPLGLPFTLVNNYGPTECTVVATSGIVTPSSTSTAFPPIGRPIANTQLFLLDEQLREVPIGASGEICIAGTGLARGYRNSAELTSTKFISTSQGRLYRTGDLARQLPGGQIEFLGRIDEQIKVRGYRIEPQEIVGALNRLHGIADSVVIAREDPFGEKRLIAYLIGAHDFDSTPGELRALLAETLPEYMLPSVFVRLQWFPLTHHGKVDYAALPEPDDDNSLRDKTSTLPGTETEKRVAAIIGGLLELDDVGVDENFFMMGGHSLLGAQLIARLRKDFGVQIGLRSLFAAPTVGELSSEIDRLTASCAQSEGVENTSAQAATEVSG